MRIRLFRSIVEEISQQKTLKNCCLVVDAQNFFFNCYEDSKLRFEFGAECDRYAEYLKDCLRMFKNANIKCYFIFKGGTKELEKKIWRTFNNPTYTHCSKFNPLFMSSIHLEVLKEMEFDYLFTEYESKTDCITLARNLACPVLSNDIEFFLSGVQYISKQSLYIDENQNICCTLSSLDFFLRNFRLNKNKVALFILLTDENIFPEKSFDIFFKFRRIPTSARYRNKNLLQMLSKTTEEEILKDILYSTEIGKEVLIKELNGVKKIVKGEVKSEVAVDYFFNRYKVTDWYIRGVAENYIAKEYIDMYRSNVLIIQQNDIDDYTDLSLNIIKYAYDLLTDFKNEGLKITRLYLDSKTRQTTVMTKSVKKPLCLAEQMISQSSWDNIVTLGLFQHFISKTIDFDCNELEGVPDDAKMLMITLVYIFHKSKLQSNTTTFSSQMAYGILLSYVMLGVVKEHINNSKIQKDSVNRNAVTVSDCESALHSLKGYFKVDDINEIMDRNLLISLKEVQMCLCQMNYLNKLCGSPFEPTIYNKTYNATFVYNIIYTKRCEDIIQSVNDILISAPSVLDYFHKIIELYNSLIQSE